MLQHVVHPDTVYVLLLLCLEKATKALNRVIFETPTEFVTIVQV